MVYQVAPGETLAQYNARIATYGAAPVTALPGSAPTVAPTPGPTYGAGGQVVATSSAPVVAPTVVQGNPATGTQSYTTSASGTPVYGAPTTSAIAPTSSAGYNPIWQTWGLSQDQWNAATPAQQNTLRTIYAGEASTTPNPDYVRQNPNWNAAQTPTQQTPTPPAQTTTNAAAPTSQTTPQQPAATNPNDSRLATMKDQLTTAASSIGSIGSVAPTVQPPSVALEPGNTGPAVQALQDYLVSRGLMTQQDLAGGYGTYGPKTTAAVAALQSQLGVDNSSGIGYFGPRTLAALQSGVGGGMSASGITTAPTAQNSSSMGDQTTQGGQPDAYSGMDPIQKQVKMYTDTYKALGLDTIKQKFEEYAKEQADLADELNQKKIDNQNNPWYSQSLVDRLNSQLDTKYQSKLDTLTHLMTLTDSLYKQGQAQVETIVSNANADIKATNDLAQKQIDAASKLGQDNTIIELNGHEWLVSKATGKKIADLGAAYHPATGGTGGNQQIDNERGLFTAFNSDPIVKDYKTILGKKLSVDQILNSKLGGPGDLATVYEFMKALDPTSVVRETEYASAAKSGNIFAGIYARFNGYLNPNGGFLPDQVKTAFQSIIDSKLKVQQNLYDQTIAQYKQMAVSQGLNPNNVTTNLNTGSAPTTGGSTSGTITEADRALLGY